MNPMLSINRANTNSLWASVLVETLYRCGLQHVVISPGSRSTPLTLAFVAHAGINSIPVLDERSAGFFALGLVKQTHKPVALVCTSGTAATNYFPAVVEASEARIPLLVLTADRPPELQDCGAGQTINQVGLYGNFPVYQEAMDMPACQLEELRSMKAAIVRAYGHALRGPVHLNLPFRDPLHPVEDGSTKNVAEIASDFFDDVVVARGEKKPMREPINISVGKGIIICGTEIPEDPSEYCNQVANLSDVSGWPVLADGLSPVRNFASRQKRLVTGYDFLLRNLDLREILRPECAIALGPLPTSKELREWLTETEVEIFHVQPTGKNLDPTGRVVQVVEVSVSEIDSSFSFGRTVDAKYVHRWLEAQGKAIAGLAEAFQEEGAQSFEGLISYLLPQYLPASTPVFVASSMPVRDVEYFWPPNDSQAQVFSSRGVNGIDGTLSTSLGVAYRNQPAVLLSGDLAFLHDSNGLLIRPKFEGHLTVILINNHGGGIFNHLPISGFEPPFDEYFGTPQEVDFRQLVESNGAEYHKLDAIDGLGDYVGELPESGIRVLEIDTNRYHDAEYRRKLFKSICGSPRLA